MTEWTIARLLSVSASYLAEKGSPSPRLDAELLLAESLGLARIDLYTQYDRPLSGDEVAAYRALVARRAQHEPVAHILGRAHFRYQTLRVTPEVLIPRPETEELVQAVLDWLREHPLVPPDDVSSQAPRIVDMGTGSGAIALSLAAEAGVSVLGVDASPAALEVAAANRDALDLGGRVELRHGDLLEGLPAGSLRIVVSNPPYVSDAEYASLAPDVAAFEPALALRGGIDGLDAYRELLPQAARALGPGGALFVEVGETQAGTVCALAEGLGFCRVASLRDLSGKERIVRAVKPGAVRVSADALDPVTVLTVRTALRSGAVVGVPTDTVYGLAAAWDSAAGVRRLFEAKGRGEERPVAALFSSVDAVRAALPDLDARALRVLDALLPGPYTLVVGTAVPRPSLVGTEDSLGVRVPDHPALLAVLDALDTPLAATSANPAGGPDPPTVDEVDPTVLAWCCAAFAPAQPSSAGIASTVVDLRPLVDGADATVIREGAVPADEVLQLIARLV